MPIGACDPATIRLIRDTAKAIGLPGIHDSTVYGSSRAYTHSSYYHHLSNIVPLASFTPTLSHSPTTLRTSPSCSRSPPQRDASIPRTPAGLIGGRHAYKSPCRGLKMGRI